MDGVGSLHDPEVVDEGSLGGDGLGADPGAAPRDIAQADGGDQPLEGPHESPARERAEHLVAAGSPVAARHRPEAAIAEGLPELSRVAVLGDSAINASHFKAVEGAGRALGVRVQALEARRSKDLGIAFDAATRERARGMIVFSSSFTFLHNALISDLAAKNKLATISIVKEFVEAGGLMAYGVNLWDLHRRCAAYVVKILKGAKPGELPVERPARFEFIVNLKAAKALGLTIPQTLLQRADEVIQ